MKKSDREHLSKVASIGCVVCRNNGYYDTPAEIHHIGNGTLSKRSSHKDVIPLCSHHHRTGGYGYAVHAGKRSWEAKYGTEQKLLKQVMGLL